MKLFVNFGRLFGLTALAVGLVVAVSQGTNASWSSPGNPGAQQTWIVPGAANVGTVIALDRNSISGAPILTGNSQSGSNGGEFRVRHIANPSSGNSSPTSSAPISQFYTFCVQTNISIGMNEQVRVQSISGQSSPPPIALSVVTSALYREFLRIKDPSSANNYFFGQSQFEYSGSGSQANNSAYNDAVLLQRAIWHFHGQTQADNSYDSVASNKFIAAGNWWVSNVNGGNSSSLLLGNVDDYGGVQILNLVNDSTGVDRQDMLVYTGTTGAPIIPEPATFALFSLGLVGCCGLLRRRSAV